jgi:hypothetical protein
MHYHLTKSPVSEDFPHTLSFGSFDRRCVLRDDAPYLCVWVGEKSLWVEEDAALFSDHLLIGTRDAGEGIGDVVYAVNLDDLSVQKFPVNGYFKQFLVTERAVYLFDACGIFALDRELHILWQNRHLAVDGVLPQEMPDENTLRIACEMDPPGGWINRTIDLRNGTLVTERSTT